MSESNNSPESGDRAGGADAISIVQRGNLKTLEKTLRKQWRLGQSIVLCWSADERGILVIFVPHYFLGNYCAAGAGEENETFVRELISGRRRKTREELFAVSERLDVAPTFIKLGTALSEDAQVIEAVDQLIRRYGLSYVDSRGVLLFDIVEFSLYTPFEQASQLNSLSYSLNSAYNKLQGQGIEINFARTTTGDGYYIWNRDLGPDANRNLFYFMLLVLADNAIARAASHGNTVPVIRTGYHIGGHYELYQAEGVNPTVFSYIVGEVTIELARMLALADPHQILIGDFNVEAPGRAGSGRTVSTPAFVNACNRGLEALQGVLLSGKGINRMASHLTEEGGETGLASPRRILIVDKHGLSRHAYNLQLDIELEDRELGLGLDAGKLSQPAPVEGLEGPSPAPSPTPAAPVAPAPSADELIDDLASLLRKRRAGGGEE